MAPEQALGDAVTDRIDIYSLGLVLFEMLTGDLALTHPVRTRQDQRAIVRLVGSELGEFIARCLNVQPASRPSAAQCHDWLAAHARRPPAQRVARWALPAALAGAALAIVAGSLAWRGGLLRAAGPSVAATTNITLSITRLPAAARIFVDARPLAADSIALASGSHEFVAVAAGYYGEVRHLTLAPGNPRDVVSFALDPTRLPTADEQQRFLKLADAAALTEADATLTTERTLSTVLRAKYLHQTGQNAQFDALSKDVETLRRFGDTRAAVASLLTGSVLSGHVNRSQVTQSLIAASAAGDAMASLYIAVAFRESINAADRPVAASDPLYRSYCQHLALAISQGWGDVASEYWRHDRCANDAGT
jgi:hypothetical protein